MNNIDLNHLRIIIINFFVKKSEVSGINFSM